MANSVRVAVPRSFFKSSVGFLLFRIMTVLSGALLCSSLLQVDQLPDISAIPIQQTNHSLTSFLGTSYRTHFLNESFPDDAVISFYNYLIPFDANETATSMFECHIIGPIVDSQVYLQIFMADNSTVTFTRARKHFLNGSYESGDGWWREQHQFDIHFNVNMSRAACLGRDTFRSGSWRKDEKPIKFEYGYAPTLRENISVNHSKRVFTIGERYELECPFQNRHPPPWIAWQLPSGEKIEKHELHLHTVGYNDGGQYTCVARNKYGNRTYVYEVSLRDPPLLEYLTTKWRRFREGVWACWGLVLIMLAHIRF